MTRPRLPLPVIGVVIPAVISLAGIVVAAASLPARDAIAVHWGADGGPDGFAPPWTVVVVMAAVALVGALTFGLMILATEADGPTGRRRFLAAVALGFATFMTVLGCWILLSQRDAGSSSPVAVGLLLALAAGALLGIVGALLSPRRLDPEPTVPAAPALDLAPDERAVWIGRTRLARAGLVAIAVAVLATLGAAVLATVVTAGSLGVIFVVPVVLLALLLVTASWTVRVDDAGLDVRSAVGWPRFRMSASDVERAAAVEVGALGEFGGWGIRLGAGRRLGVILRSGTALEARRRDGRALVVTVDDAGTAAALLSAVAERATAPRG